MVSFGNGDFLGLLSFRPYRVRYLVSLTDSLGREGGVKVPRELYSNGGVTLVFRGADAHAHYDFRITTCSLNVNIACLSPRNSRVNGGRDVTSATEILNEVCSNVRCHNFRRRVIRRLSGCTNIPI